MSYIPPPSPPGRLGWVGQGALPVSADGLFISPGVGLFPRTQGGQLLLDGTSPNPGGDFCGQIPGPVAAAVNRYRFRNAFPSGRAVISVAEANLGVAAAGTSAANHYGLTVAGSLSGIMTVPMYPDGPYFVNDLGSPVHSIGADPSEAPYTGAGGNHVNKGAASPFSPTATQTIETLGFYLPNNAGYGPGGGWLQDGIYSGFFEILDANLNPLVSVPVGSRLASPGWTDVQLPLQLTLTQGVTYYAAVRVPGGPDGAQGLILEATNVPQIGMTNPGIPGFGGPAFYQLYTGAGDDFSPEDVDVFTGANLRWRIGTVPVGVAIAGDLLVSVALTGVAPVTPGADLGFRISMAGG